MSRQPKQHMPTYKCGICREDVPANTTYGQASWTSVAGTFVCAKCTYTAVVNALKGKSQ